MSVSLALPCLGLAPDSHAIAAPKGSMRHAEHVVCDLPGIVRARPSFELGTQKTSTYSPISMRHFGSSRICVTFNGSLLRLESESATITGNAIPPDFDARETSFAEARRNLYYTSDTGVRALRAEADTSTTVAGLDLNWTLSPGRLCFYTGTDVPGPYPIGSGQMAYAYCMVVKRTDANGYVRRSPPTSAFYRSFTLSSPDSSLEIAAGPTTTDKAILFTGAILEGDVIEFYRTRIVFDSLNASVGADYYLATSYTITAADVAAGYFPPSQTIIADTAENDELGEALYTNPQREGALAAKYGPPVASELALWQSCLWYGKTVGPHRLALSFADVGNPDNPRPAPSATSFGYLVTTGDFAIGNPDITNVASVDGCVVGMYVCLTASISPFESPATGVVPVATTVLAINGAGPYTVTMSANATGNAVGASFRMADKVTIAGTDFVAGPSTPRQTAALGGRQQFYLNMDVSPKAAAARELSSAITDAAVRGLVAVYARWAGSGESTGVAGGSALIDLTRTVLTASSFTVTSTKPQAFVPQLGTGVTSTQDDKPHRVYYSLPDEPEAVPLLNYIDIGSEAAAIQRLVPLADALLVFKQDGLYRITGSAPDRWSVTLLDPTLCLVRPEACAVLDDTAYCWTNRGVCAVDETGVRQIVSAGKIDTELFQAQGAILGDSTYHGCRILTSPRHQLVLLTVPNTFTEDRDYCSLHVWCFAKKTGAWTKWPDTYIRCGDTASDGVLWTAVNNSLNELEWETRYLRDTARGYDRLYEVASGSGAPTAWTQTASSTAMSITNAQRGEWVPTVGDWVYWTIGSDYWRRIIAVSDDGGGDYSWTLDSAAPSNIGSATAKGCVVGSPVLLEWLPSVSASGGVTLPVWRGLTFTLEGEATAKTSPTDFRVTLGVRHDGASGVASVVGTPDRSTVQVRPYRMGWPRNGSRRPDVGPRLSWSEIDWPWRLAGVALIGEGGSERVRT